MGRRLGRRGMLIGRCRLCRGVGGGGGGDRGGKGERWEGLASLWF